MSKGMREVWRCDLCGWEWLPDKSKVPERCPNRSCRKRNWNRGAVTQQVEGAVPPIQNIVHGKNASDKTALAAGSSPASSTTNWDAVYAATRQAK